MLRGGRAAHRVAGFLAVLAGTFWIASAMAASGEDAEQRKLLDRAAVQFRDGDYDQARRSYEAVTEADPGSIRAWLGLGWSLWQLGERDRAFGLWQDLAKVRADDPDLMLALAQAHEFRDEWDEALTRYSQVLEHQPARIPALMGRARIHHREGRQRAAERDLRIVLAEDPEDFDAQFLLAQIYKLTGRNQEATRLFDRLARRGPDPRYLRQLADVMLELGRSEEAIRYYEGNLRRNPGNRGTILGLARAHADLHQYTDSVGYLERYLASHPEDAKIREELARFASYGGNYQKAEEHLRILVERHPEEVKWQISLARLLQEKGEIEEPLRLAKAALQEDPNHVEALQLVLDSALSADRYEEGIRWLERLVAVKPSGARLNQLGDLYLGLGERLAAEGNAAAADVAFERSVQAFEASVEQNPRSADAHLGVATALRLKGDYAKAVEVAARILERYPNLERARRELYESYAGLGEFEKAEEWLRSTLEMFPGNLRLTHQLAKIRFKKGERNEAIADARALLDRQLQKSVPVLLYHGVSEASTREDTMSVANFRDQMKALREAGYQSISVHDLLAFLDGKTALPEKPILITFDDARADSYRYADPILRETGFEVTMFIPVAEVGKHGPFNAVWSTVREKYETGRWDVQCHSHLGHRPIPVDADGTQGPFLANRMWLEEEKRLETTEEFVARLETDYRRCAEGLREKLPDIELAGYAYPFGEIGQKSFSNEPSAVEVNRALAERYYRVGFIQDPAASVDLHSGHSVLPRFEVPREFRGKDLLRHLKAMDPYTSTMLLVADLYAWDGRFADATMVYDQIADYENVDRADLLTRRGRVDMWQGDFARARESLESAQALRPDDDTILRSVHQLDLRTSPEVTGQALFYGDNSDRQNFSIGPSGTAYLSDRVSLSAAYRYKRFLNENFDTREMDDPNAPPEDRDGDGQLDPADRIDLETAGNEFEARLAYQVNWRTRVSVAAGAVTFTDESSTDRFGDPDPYPLVSGAVDFGIGDRADVSLRGGRSYVGAAGAILDELGTTEAEGKLEVRPLQYTTLQGRLLFHRYDDGNRRNTAIANALQEIWSEPVVKVGYRFTYDDALEENPFFYTPEQFVGNDGVFRLELEPFPQFALGAEAAVGVGRESGTDTEPQASFIGDGRLAVWDRFSVFAAAGRSQAARFESFHVSGGVSATF